MNKIIFRERMNLTPSKYCFEIKTTKKLSTRELQKSRKKDEKRFTADLLCQPNDEPQSEHDAQR